MAYPVPELQPSCVTNDIDYLLCEPKIAGLCTRLLFPLGDESCLVLALYSIILLALLPTNTASQCAIFLPHYHACTRPAHHSESRPETGLCLMSAIEQALEDIPTYLSVYKNISWSKVQFIGQHDR